MAEYTLKDFANDVAQYGGALASGLGDAANTYAGRIAELGGPDLVDAETKYSIAAEEFGNKFAELARNSRLWAEAAESAKNSGIADVMRKYADDFQKQAETLADARLTASQRWQALEAQSALAVKNAEQAFGRDAGKYGGAVLDGAQMLAGAYEWSQTGSSQPFGEACAGVLASAGLGYAIGLLAGLGAAALGLSAGTAAAGVALAAGVGAFAGAILGGKGFAAAYDDLVDWASRFLEWSGVFREVDKVLDAVQTFFASAKSFVPRRDPLVFDLDGDGIETIGAGGTSTVLFDHDGDGIKTGTGWVKGDDGFLVLDRNGNGTIDNGAELFGIDTVLASGKKATDGFSALKDLDSNGDGVFSAADTQFANVRVWRDLNQDGISQADELKSLAATGIASINLTPTSTNTPLPGGNTQTAAGTFTRTNGTTGTVADAAVSSIGNLNLVDNPFYREFPDHIPLTDATRSLPHMHGSGAVRDLREAATLNADLAAELQALQSTPTRANLHARIDTIIADWAKSAGFVTTVERLADLTSQPVYMSCAGGFIDGTEVPKDMIDWAIATWGEPPSDYGQTASAGGGGGGGGSGGATSPTVMDEAAVAAFRRRQQAMWAADHFISCGASPIRGGSPVAFGTGAHLPLEAFNGQNFLDFRQTPGGKWGVFTGAGQLVWGAADDTPPPPPTAGAGGGGGGGGGAGRQNLPSVLSSACPPW